MTLKETVRQILPPIAVSACRQLFSVRKKPGVFDRFLDEVRREGIIAESIPTVADDEASWFIACFRRIQRESRDFPVVKLCPFFNDRWESAGRAQGHYFYQDLHVAQLVHADNPRKHVDIGSRFDGFIAHVASFRTLEVLDIRSQFQAIKNVTFRQADLTRHDSLPRDYCDSISCLHALEHFGLGRYGDPIDAQGHEKALRGFWRLLEPGGILYLAVPIGPQRIEFNAHRVFDVDYLVRLTTSAMRLEEISYVDDLGNFHEDVALSEKGLHECTYGCAILALRKSAA
jgi:SAM-dependent methyltransferase